VQKSLSAVAALADFHCCCKIGISAFAGFFKGHNGFTGSFSLFIIIPDVPIVKISK